MRQCLVFIVFLLFSYGLYSQENRPNWSFNEVPLDNLIESLEEKYELRFSYTNNTTAGQVFSYQGNATLKELLDILESQFLIEIRKIDANNYIITKQSTTQNVCGTIINQYTNTPLEGASIFALNSLKGTTTDGIGRFELQGIHLDDTLLIQSLGFEEIRIEVGDFSKRDCLTIPLLQGITSLDAIVLTEYLTTGFDRNTVDGSLTLTPKKLGVLPGLTEPDVLQSLQLIPGISSPSETASGLFVRGGTPDQNLVLWDGIKMYHQGHFFGQISAFNPYITDKVDIYRSGTSAVYGDRISSVINIESATKTPKKIRGGAGFNFTQADAYVHVPIDKKWGLLLSARSSYSDLLETITFTKISEKVFQNTKISETGAEDDDFEILSNNFQFRDVSAKLNYNDEKQRISISTLFLNNTLDFSARNDFIFTADDFAVSNNGVSASWNRNITSKWSLNLSGYYSLYDSNFTLQENENNNADLLQIRKENAVNDKGFTVGSNLEFNDSNTLISGYEYSNNRVSYLIEEIEDGNPEIDQRADDTLISHSLFSEYTYNHKQWLLRGGIRVNYLNNEQAWYLEPRVFLKYAINKNLSLQSSVEIKNQSVSQLVDFEFNEIGVGENIWVLADDEDIPVLNNRQLTVGILFEKSGWSLDVEGYLKRIQGISTLSRSFESITVENLDLFPDVNSNIFGVDFLLKKRFKNFRTWVSYTFNQTQFSFDGSNGDFPGTYDQPHNLSLANTLTLGKFQCSLGWTFTSGRPFSQPSGIVSTTDEEGETELELNYPNLNNQRLQNYHRLDASFFYEYYFGKEQDHKIRLGISIFNIYNQRNQLEKSFRIDENEDSEEASEIVERIRFGQGFTPNVVCRVFF